MPLTRYQIRSEFSLADPELYRTADRNDPEALLEGVAMAGLVGVLRQLGDLAEFAAEIFHDLHEELMTTAARGHGLTLRVQQLEAEVPSIEKAFLSETTHSSFVHNAGIDWHPNLRDDQNLITRGDLPRFVMDSYEECRGPPKLFLLDKFDIAGAGACLKRYSDPSFFRADLTTTKDVKRDKRARKVKKKVPRWKNVETPELTSSHSKLHQLFSEEHQRSENIIRNHHVKLKKRQSNSSYADAATGRSYMERFLPSSPEEKSVSQRFSSPSHLKMEISNFGELVPSLEIPSNSPANKLVTRDESSVPPQTAQEKALDPSSNEPSEDVIEEENMKKLPESTTDVELDGISPTLHKAENTKELVLCSERNSDVNGYQSDDATSEMENYVDALATIESEMETDSESRPKNEHRVMINKKLIDFGGNGEQKELHDNFLDSHSRGSSIASYDQDTPLKKGRSISSYSESSSNSAENVTSDGNLAAKLHPYPHDEVSYSSPKMTSAMGNDLRSKSEKYVVPDSTFSEAPSNPSNYASQFREESYNSELTNSTPGSCDSSSGVSLKEVQPSGLKSSEVSCRHMNSAVGESSPRTEIDGGNRKDDLPSSNNVFKNSSELRWYSPSVGSQQIQSLEMLGGENPDSFSLAGEETGNDHVATFEARSLSDDANDNQTENLVNGKTDSTVMPESILDSPADVNLSDARSDGIVMEAGSVTQTAESSECSTLVIDRPATDDFGEQKHREMADLAPPLEWDSAEIGNVGNELEPSCSDLESIDEFGADRVSLDSPATKRKVDVSTERNISDAQDLVSAEENHLHLHGLEAENVCTDDGENAKGDHMPTGSLCSDQIELQECQPSSEDSDKRKLEIIEVSNLNDVVRLDAEDEAENQPQGAPSNSNIDIVEDTQDHLQHSDGTDASLLKETDHDLESKQATQLSASANDMSSSIHLSEPGLPLEQGLESEAEEDNMPYNQEVNENSNLFYHQYDQGQSQKKIESNECSNALPMSSSVESLSQQSDLNLPYQSKTYEPSMVPSQQVSHDFDVPSEATIQVLGTSLPDHNVLAASPEEMPPLPPLPPVQWRIGKLRFGFPSSEGESAQHSFNPLLLTSAEAADERTQQGFPTFSGEVVQPLSPFSLNPSPDDKMIEHSSEILGRETSQTSPSTSSSPLPVFSQEKIQQDSFTSHRTGREPLNPFSPLSDEEPRHDSSDFGELLDPSHMNLLAPAPAPAVDDSSTRHVSSTSQKELEQSLDLSACIPNKEDEKLHDNLSSKQGTKEPQSSFTPPTIENEESRHDSWTLEGEREWQSNLPIFMPPTAEDGKPNGTKKSWLIRPRSPLIEAVASHDKSNLRKVTERALPQTGPKADERNSLLEQIRTKSFNLKPASLTRPSIKGPETNLKVVAILEKANAIRQALAGSDEDDDEESWSDS